MASPKGAAIAKDGDGLRRYLQQIQKLPMLGAQEELELSRRWRKDQDDNAAKQLVASHLRLVAKIAFSLPRLWVATQRPDQRGQCRYDARREEV